MPKLRDFTYNLFADFVNDIHGHASRYAIDSDIAAELRTVAEVLEEWVEEDLEDAVDAANEAQYDRVMEGRMHEESGADASRRLMEEARRLK